jgi:hypothetical protein
MRVLLVHPEDGLLDGPWANASWHRVIDLGCAGSKSYERASRLFGCAVTSLREFRRGFTEFHRVRELLALGLGPLTDRFGLDWWELTAILIHQQLEMVILLQKFAETLGSEDEVYVSRPGLHANALKQTLGGARVHVLSSQTNQTKRGAGHYLRLWKKFPVKQLLEIFWDKSDPGYQFRGRFTRSRKPVDVPLVLLPSAYVNVTRTGFAYAATVPDVQFLLVATRRSGWIEKRPPNVASAWLCSYASVREAARKAEYLDLTARWGSLRRELELVPEFGTISKLGCFDDFPDRFSRGLEIRDAWRNVLQKETVQSVICADDSNPYTHIPLLLAKNVGLRTISCHHGALDGRYMFKRSHADILLAKGKMEEDFLVRLCELPASQVQVGAPAAETALMRDSQSPSSSIVFFSELYEAMGGRVRDSYQDILPPLADLALSQGRELIVKLHPAESVAERWRALRETLAPAQQRIVRIVGGSLQPELLSNAWFGITVLSTVAVECALRGVPCFLCGWLESSPYGYVDQFTRFGIGTRLNQAEEIKQIPQMLQDLKPNPSLRENCWNPIERERLQSLLGMSPSPQQVVSRKRDSGE